jgi:hypothetical protein
MEVVLMFFGAVLFGLLASLPALAQKQHWRIVRTFWKTGTLNCIRAFATEEWGVVVVTYCNRGFAISVTPLTQSQAAQVPTQAAQVFFADTDTQAVFVHNWGLPNSYPNWLLPQIFFDKSLGAATDSSFRTNFTFGLTNTNSVTMNKIGVGTGSGGTYNVYLRRGDGAEE